jgi:UDP-2,3-diacylglucosamine hydrolase
MTINKADIFVADAHIKNGDSACAKKFLRFLDDIKDSTRTLFILGDLFDFWFGKNRAFFTVYRPILDKFIQLKESGVDFVYVEGNHEVCMGPFFTKTLNAKVFSYDGFLDLNDKRLYISHGDKMNRKDIGHLFLRWLLRSWPMRFLMWVVPSWIIIPTSKKISGTSRNYSTEKKEVFTPEMVDAFFDDKRKKGAEYVIFAHTHKETIEKRGDAYLINPGAFMENGSYAKYEAGSFTLCNFD